MKQSKKLRANIARILAAAMVFTMAAPAGGLSAYAATIATGQTAKVVFRPSFDGLAPAFSGQWMTHNYSGAATENFPGIPSTVQVPSAVFTGPAGTPMLGHGAWAGAPTTGHIGSGDRPEVPAYNNAAIAPYGYAFEGWYEADSEADLHNSSKKITRLPYAYPHEDVTIYTGKWTVNSSATFNITRKDLRVFGTPGDPFADPAGVSDGIKFATDEVVVSGQPLNAPVSGTYRSDIPGYIVSAGHIRYNRLRRVGEAPGAGTGAPSVILNPSTRAITGKMTNDNVQVVYNYEPDATKTFRFVKEYILRTPAGGGTFTYSPIASMPAEVDFKSAEAVIAGGAPASPIAGGAYIFAEARVKPGTGDSGTPASTRTYPVGYLNGMGPNDIFNGDGSLKAGIKMPNQPLTVQYVYEMNPAYTLSVNIRKIFDGDSSMDTPLSERDVVVAVGSLHTVPVSYVPGYNLPNPAYSSTFSPIFYEKNPTRNNTTDPSDPAPTNIADARATGVWYFRFQPQAGAGQYLELKYAPDYSDASVWARITHNSSGNGTVTSPQLFVKHARVQYLDELTAGTNPTPNTHYRFGGWYKSTDLNTRLGGEGEHIPVPISGQTQLTAVFEKNPSDWFDINFIIESPGMRTGGSLVHTDVERNTRLAGLTPRFSFPSTYDFTGWYLRAGGTDTLVTSARMLPNTLQASADAVYVAKFQSNLADDGLLAIPDVRGSVGSDGMGVVEVTGPNSNRYYAVTDENGAVIKILPGSAIAGNGGKITGLEPGRRYLVYEVASAAGQNLANQVAASPPGSVNIAVVEDGAGGGVPERSLPARVTVPAVNPASTTVSEGGNGTRIITINPSVPGMSYGVVDSNGNTVPQPGSSDGWVPGTGGPLILEGLEPGNNYTVVVKPAASPDTPEQRTDTGTVIYSGAAATVAEYIFRVTGEAAVGAHITTLSRGSQTTNLPAGTTSIKARAGDRIRISGNPAGANQRFRWAMDIGNAGFAADRKDQMVTMPAGDVVMRGYFESTFTPPVLPPVSGVPQYHPAPPSADIINANSALDYAPKNGSFAIEGSDYVGLRDRLINNADDDLVIRDGRNLKLKYTVNFNTRVPLASESDAVAQSSGVDTLGLKVPVALQIGLSRQIDGVNKPLTGSPGDTTHLKVVGRLDEALLGGIEYKVFKILGTGVLQELPVDRDPDESFSGIFTFDANIGDTYVISYNKVHRVQIENPRLDTPSTHLIQVVSGEPLNGSPAYAALGIDAGYTNSLTGRVYRLLRFVREGTGVDYAASAPVVENLHLRAVYEEVIDPNWAARNAELGALLNRANALVTTLTGRKANELQAAIDAAFPSYTQTALADNQRRPSVAEIEAAIASLQAAIDAIRPDPQPTPPPTPTPPPPAPLPPSGGGGGGGGGTGISGRPGARSQDISAWNSYRTFINNTEGRWEQAEGGKWRFFVNATGEMVRDEWINVVYPFVGVRRTSFVYHFDGDGFMTTGWFQSGDGRWYYFSEANDSTRGQMMEGWHFSQPDGKWYYLNKVTGYMLTGWQEVDDKWYYLTPVELKSAAQPHGSLFVNTQTPDGHPVNSNGEWINR